MPEQGGQKPTDIPDGYKGREALNKCVLLHLPDTWDLAHALRVTHRWPEGKEG
jgi:hypothetical protein